MEVLLGLDPRYEFFAPKYHDFSLEETALDIGEAEHWFETFLGYEDSPHAHRKFADLTGDVPVAPANHTAAEPLSERNLNVAEPLNAAQPLSERSLNVAEPLSSRNLIVASNQIPAFKEKKVPAEHSRQEQEQTRGKENCSSAIKVQQFSNVASPSKQILASKEQRTPFTELSKCGKSRAKESCFVFKAKDHRTPLFSQQKTAFGESEHCKRAQSRGCSAIKESNSSSPFVSLAEKVLRFQIKTPERFRSQQDGKPPLVQQKTELKLTVPKEPDFETSHRARPPRVKSSAEIEEEMLSKLPKFKARPLNKKIFEAPTLPTIPRSIPQPEFEIFHLKTAERAMQHACASSSSVMVESKQRRKSAPGSLTEPQLRTAARARPVRIKSSEELEREEMEKMPKFKARPLNKKIFESRGDLGVYRSHKRQRTVPVEFHFATDERFQRADEHPLLNKLDKELALPSGPTRPTPFNLVTEQRGAIKEMKFIQELFEREMAEREMRVPKAQPLPFTTDIPSIPSKPAPKECTKPQPFELESLVRHEEEMQKKAEEVARLELEAAEMRRFTAQPFACSDHVFIPERSRKPLTEVQEFSMRVDSRAVDRAEFDKKVMEKQNEYTKFREELEAARKAEEDKIVKALRKEMVPLARPMPVFGKPFVPSRSTRQPTRCVSPKLRVLARKERRQSTERRQSMERRRSLEQSRALKNNNQLR